MKKLFEKNAANHRSSSAFSFVFALVLLAIGGNVYASGDHDHEEKEEQHSAEPVKGPHQGRLLKEGDFTLELAIFERGVPPEYRAWGSYKGAALAAEDWQLSVAITRLGGKVDKFSFIAQEDFLRGQGQVLEPHSFDVSVTATYQKQSYQWSFPSYEGRLQLSSELARQAGLSTAVAGAGKLQQQLKLYGQLLPDASQVRQLKARFPGVIGSFKVAVGSQVSAGDTLVSIEANDSLRSYKITAPISGVVIERNGNEGEVTADQALLTIADYRQLSVNLPIFARDIPRVKLGQPLQIKSADGYSHSRLLALTPAADGSPTSIAGAAVDNSNQQWIPGTWVDAAITLAEIPVALMVDRRALQTFRDWQVVFIQVGDTYEIRPLELGRSDGQFSEVLGGLNSGDRYVLEQSYLLKADLEKSGASHDH